MGPARRDWWSTREHDGLSPVPVHARLYGGLAPSLIGLRPGGQVLAGLDEAIKFLATGMVRHASTQKVNLLASQMRFALLEAVKQRPGILLSDLRKLLGCSAGTIQHHLMLMERHGLVASERDGKRRRIYLGSIPAADRRKFTAVQSGRTEQLVRTILERPGIVQRELTEGLVISRKVLRGYMDRLTDLGLVDEVSTGRSRTYFPAEHLKSFLEALAPPSLPEVAVIPAPAQTSQPPSLDNEILLP